MFKMDDLRQNLRRIDGRGYKAYKDIQGSYTFKNFDLHIDYVQGDPFASPSKIRIRMPQSVAKLPEELFQNSVRRIALQDFLATEVYYAIRHEVQGRRGSGKSGLITIDAGGQEVLERTAVLITPQWVEARMHVGLPAAGRKVLGRQADEMLCQEIPEIIYRSLIWRNIPHQEAQEFVECIENQEHIRQQLDRLGLIAFVANASILPRESGASDFPLSSKTEKVIPFQSPLSLKVTIDVPNSIYDGGPKQVSGMGIPKGVTLIVGGGYHGKSTLLKALERGVYPHIPGDGREYVVTCHDTVKIRAEDGRRVESVDITSFINNLPYGRSTTAFSTDDASGSTSQAANIIEALEMGAKVLLLDEDTSATNFMIRDARMQALVQKTHEPITPFLDRVHEIYENFGISTVLVMGGSGDYIDVADTVIMMRDYLPVDVTTEAKEIAQQYQTQRHLENPEAMPFPKNRIPLAESFDASRGRKDVKIDAKGIDLILYGSDPIELRGVEQLVDLSQTRAVGYAIHLATEKFMDGKITLKEVLDAIEQFFNREGLDELDPFRRRENHPGNFARPRRYEIAAAINRLRTVRMRQK